MYIEEILKDLNNNMKEINDKLGKFLARIEEPVLSKSGSTKTETIQAKVTMPDEALTANTTPAQEIVLAPVEASVEASDVAPVIPTSVETYTREDIAKAMASAMDMGKMGVIQKILTTYNAQSLMDIAPENYGSIALMLREAGVKI